VLIREGALCPVVLSMIFRRFLILPPKNYFCVVYELTTASLIREGTLPSVVLDVMFCRILILPPKLLPRCL
jgi:hypothetical protein